MKVVDITAWNAFKRGWWLGFSAGLLLGALLGFAASAKAEPNAELTAACTDDAKRVCSWAQLLEAAAGHYTGISVCFRRHHAQLSGSCKVALAKYGYK